VATLFIPARLRRLTGGLDRLAVDGDTVGALLEAVDRRFQGFRAAVVTGDEIDAALAVAVDGDVLAGGLAEPVGPSSEVHLIPALSGG
jgi:molybdopterin converting factor small subunit